MSTDEVSVTYRDVGVDGLDEIESSWDRLREFHIPLSVHFADEIRRRSFADRRDELCRKAAEGAVRVDVATLASTGQCVGHCISSRAGATGEIESLHVDETLRGHGIGTTLMQRALAWFDEQQATKRKVALLVENDAALRFYERFGFRARAITMQMVPEER
jgi:ribosomal protein S18 acetylase RimI-like enzyme